MAQNYMDWMKLYNGQQAPQTGSTDMLSSVGQGAAQGAMSGAALGPWGAAAGGVIGAAGAAVNASDAASDKQVADQKKENEMKLLYQKFLQSKRQTDEEMARGGLDMFLNIGSLAQKEYKGSNGKGRHAALRAAGVI
jgi:hypothetical protein